MMTQKLILKATAALTLVGLSGGLLIAEPQAKKAAKTQPKNEQLAYRFVKGTTNGLGSLAAYTAQTKINFWKRAIKNPAVSFTFGAFVAAPVLRQTLFSITPETNVKELAKKVVLHDKHDLEQAKKNLTIGYESFLKWYAPKAEKAQVVATKAADYVTPKAKIAFASAEDIIKKTAEVKAQANEQREALQNEKFQEVKKDASNKAAALAKWFQDLRK